MWPFKKKEKKVTPVTEEKVLAPKIPEIPVTPVTPVVSEVSKKEETIDLKSMTVVELKALAKERNLEGCSSLKKAELIDLLK